MMTNVAKEQTTSPEYMGKQPHPTSPIREECLLETSLIGEETKVRLLKKEKIKKYNF